MAETKAKRKSSTKKSTTSKTTAKKAAPAKASATVVRTVSGEEARAMGTTKKSKLPDNVLSVVLAELVGTFVLAAVATMTAASVTPLFVGLTLAALVIAIGAISGTHINPAVTFGLWTMRKVKSIMLPFYWGAQLLGGMLAVVVTSLVSGKQLGLDFGHFFDFSTPIFLAEMIGTAIFLFILTMVLNRSELSANGKAIGVGFSLFIGLVVASSLFAPAVTKANAQYLKDLQSEASNSSSGVDYAALRKISIPAVSLVGDPTLNPAIALASTESKSAESIYQSYGINDSSATNTETSSTYSRFTLQVILSTLLGAALGANFTRVFNTRSKKS